MHPIMDLCFLCTKDYNCVLVDTRIESQVEYILPEITIFKLGLPLRICSVCDGALYAFTKFKQFYVESSKRLEASIKGAQGPPLHTDIPQIAINEISNNTQPENIKDTTYKEEEEQQISLQRNTTPLEVQLHTNEPSANVQLHTNSALLDPIIELQIDNSVPETQLQKETENSVEQLSLQDQCSTKSTDGASIAMDTEPSVGKSETIEEVFIKEEMTDEPSENIEMFNMFQTLKDNCENNREEHNMEDVNEEMWEELENPSGVTDLQCEICNKSFSYQFHFDYHMKIHSVQNLTCSICHKLLPNRTSVIQHMKTHSMPKKFACSVCNKAFPCRSQLNQHVKIHSEVKEFQCEICNKSYTQKYNFDYHMKTHSGIKDFPCFLCNKAFACSSTLKRHVKTHTGIKDFACELCGKSFAQKHHLDNHTRTHSKRIQKYLT